MFFTRPYKLKNIVERLMFMHPPFISISLGLFITLSHFSDNFCDEKLLILAETLLMQAGF